MIETKTINIMKKILITIVTITITALSSCSQNTTKKENVTPEKTSVITDKIKQEPHKYGGWYCPDNLNGFPPVDIKNWNNVPVINGRLATKEETQTESSLIFVDTEKYPNAKPLDITMPKLAKFYNEYSKKEELVIVIQALKIQNDSIVGFRFLNGGNGSAKLNEVKFISDNEIEKIESGRFISLDIKIKAKQDEIWKVMTKSDYTKTLQPIFDNKNILNKNWKETSNVNFQYASKLEMTSEYADKLFGCWYIQNDYLINNNSFVEKFLLLENEEQTETELKIAVGPFGNDYNSQKFILTNWMNKVKQLSEKE